MAFLLNSQAVLLCPHGGTVQHIPNSFTTYRINGYPPLLLNDTYIVSGCPFMIASGGTAIPMNCRHVQWFTGSPMMMVNGIPVLTNTSTGLCMSATGGPGGPVIIATTINIEEEPKEFTNITK